MKLCPKCRKAKSEDQFHKKKTGKDGLQADCKSCVSAYSKAHYVKNREVVLRKSREYMQRRPEKRAERNRRAKEWRRLNPQRALELARKWKLANRERYEGVRRSWGKRHPEKLRASQRRKQLKKYGLIEADFSAMLTRQNSKCAICKDLMHKPCIDHCHATGKIRALLCHSCNTAIGHLKDSPATIRAAADYVEKFSAGTTPAES